MSLLCRFICQYALSQVVDDAFLRKSRRCSALTMLEGENGAIVRSILARMHELLQLYPLNAQFGTAPTEQDAARVLGDQQCDSLSHILVKHDWKH